MTKTLTEQWKDGELPEDTYYVEFLCGRYRTYEFNRLEGFGFDNDLAYIKEVLEPVPSYEEWKRFQEQLSIATKALEDLELANDIRICIKAQETLEEMEGVK